MALLRVLRGRTLTDNRGSGTTTTTNPHRQQGLWNHHQPSQTTGALETAPAPTLTAFLNSVSFQNVLFFLMFLCLLLVSCSVSILLFPVFCFQFFVSSFLFPVFCFQFFVSSFLFPVFCFQSFVSIFLCFFLDFFLWPEDVSCGMFLINAHVLEEARVELAVSLCLNPIFISAFPHSSTSHPPPLHLPLFHPPLHRPSHNSQLTFSFELFLTTFSFRPPFLFSV